MLKTMFVHIGPPKTGTTSIQRTFFNNAAVLEEHGLFYYTGRWSHHPVSRQMHRTTRSDRYERTTKDFFATAAASSCEHGFFSSEMLVVLTHREIAEFRRQMLEVAEHVKVIAYARHPVSFAVSVAHQAVRAGKPIEQIEQSPNMRSLPNLFERWSKVVGPTNMIVRPFDRAQLVGGDVVDDVLDVIGLAHLGPRMERVRANEGLSVLALSLIEEFNRRDPETHQLRKPYLRAVNKVSGPRYVLPAETLETVRITTAADVIHLRRRWGVDLPEPFPEPSQPLGLNAAEVASLTDMVLTLIRKTEEERAKRKLTRRTGSLAKRLLGSVAGLWPWRRKRPGPAPDDDEDDEGTGQN